MAFYDIAKPMALRGEPQIRIRPGVKAALDKNWPDMATTDLAVLQQLSHAFPECNSASVAKGVLGGSWYLEIDDPTIQDKIENETGHDIPRTFMVQSSIGKYHYYWKQTPESIAMGSITQSDTTPWSVRVHNEYVLSPGSIHPVTGRPYQIFDDAAIVPAPRWLIDWLDANRPSLKARVSTDGEPFIVREGGRDNFLASSAGHFRNQGMTASDILPHLRLVNESTCVPPLPESDLVRIANSIGTRAISTTTQILVGGIPIEEAPIGPARASQSAVQASGSAQEPLYRASPPVEFEYPYWAWKGTLYEKFANTCGRDNKVPKEYFIEVIKTLVGAICGHRIHPFGMEDQEARFYTVLLSKEGGTGKSSAVKWARAMLERAGLIWDVSNTASGLYQNIGVAVGSFASGAGLEANGTNRHSRLLLWYDEVTTLIEKFGIQGSGEHFLSSLNTLFESGYAPKNHTKDSKLDNKAIPLCHVSLLGCSVFEKWNAAFGKASAEGSGFFQRLNIVSSRSDERVVNFFSPDLGSLAFDFEAKIRPLEDHKVVIKLAPEANEFLTEWHRDKKVQWKQYSWDVKGRIEVLIHRNISHLAWLLDGQNSQEIICDLDCVTRSVALAEYQVIARASHTPAVGKNDWALVESLIRNNVRESGSIGRRDLYAAIGGERFGIRVFEGAVNSLISEGIIETVKTSVRKEQKLFWPASA